MFVDYAHILIPLSSAQLKFVVHAYQPTVLHLLTIVNAKPVPALVLEC